MSYIIKRYDINTMCKNACVNIREWSNILCDIESTINGILFDHDMAGVTADGIKVYLEQMHLPVIRILKIAMEMYMEAAAGYAEGFSDLKLDYADGNGAKIGDADVVTEDHLNEIVGVLEGITAHIQETVPRAENVIRTVSDIMPDHDMQAPEVYSAPMEDQSTSIAAFRDDVGTYDGAFASEALENIRDLIAEARQFTDRIKTDGVISFSPGYTSSFFSQIDTVGLVEKIMAAEVTVEVNRGLLKKGSDYLVKVYDERRADARERIRVERINNGLKLTGTAVIGVVTTIATCGAAIPEELAICAGIIDGMLLTVNFSSGIEGVQDLYYGVTGDIETPAYNLVRDGLFDGDKDQYELFVLTVEGMNAFVGSCGNIITAGTEVAAEQGMKVMTVTAVEEAASVWAGVAIDSGMEKLSDSLGDSDPFTEMAIKDGLGFLLSQGADMAIHGAGDEIFLHPDEIGEYIPPKFEELTDEEVRALAEEAMKGNPDANSIVIGKHDLNGVDYQTIAKEYYGKYFNLESWDGLAETYSGTQMWRINQKYLEMQIQAGNRIYLTHDPDIFRTQYTSGFGREIAYLEAKGYTFKEVELVKGDTTQTVFVAVMGSAR